MSCSVCSIFYFLNIRKDVYLKVKFEKYQHIERLENEEVEGIEIGKCYVFPKIDGTNSSVWMDNGEIKAGSRRRELNELKDNADFYKFVLSNSKLKDYLLKYPKHRLFGEFLIPHSLRTYENSAWNKFYIFDVVEEFADNGFRYLKYEEYKLLLDEFNLDYIPPIMIIENGTIENFEKCLDKNTFLIKDGCGVGEGIVIKNYEYRNKYGRQTWAKIVTNEFKTRNIKEMGSPSLINSPLEKLIVDEYVTKSLIEKEHSKIVNEKGWDCMKIPELLNRVYHSFVTEDLWQVIKKHKQPVINFKSLYKHSTSKVKEIKPELF